MKQCFLLFAFYSTFIYSQQNKVIILDSITKQPVQYANIKYLKSLKGTFTDSLGICYINKSLSEKAKISVLGYKSKVIDIKNINDSIILSPKVLILDEIVIKNNSKKDYDYGFHKNKGKYIGSSVKRAIVAVYIPNKNPNIKSYISKLHFKIKKSGKYISIIRPHLFSKKEKAQIPDKELFNYNLLIKQKKSKKGILSIDISDKNIIFPRNGIFVALEWVGNTTDIDFGYNSENKNSSDNLTVLTSNEFKKNVWVSMTPFGKKITANFGITTYIDED